MTFAYFYQYIYLFFVTVFTVAAYFKYSRRTVINGSVGGGRKYGSFLLVAFFILLVGLRPNSGAFVDMMNYHQWYYYNEGEPFVFDPSAENFIFDNLFLLWSSARLGFTSFMVLICTINFGCMYVACKRLFPNDTLAAFLVFLGAFSTFSYATNGIKAGAAAAVFVLALSYYKKWIVYIPLLLATYGMHHSMILPVAACVVAHFIRNPKLYLWGWILCVLISALHITFFQNIFANLTADTMDDAHGAAYLQSVNSDWGGKSGFRLDFVLYSSMPVLIGYYAIVKKKIHVSQWYAYLLNVYLIVNSVWMLCMYANFTNRIAYLSWLMYPVVLAYPFLCEDWGTRKYKTFAKVMVAHLGFTLFMQIVYYT